MAAGALGRLTVEAEALPEHCRAGGDKSWALRALSVRLPRVRAEENSLLSAVGKYVDQATGPQVQAAPSWATERCK